MNKQFKSLAIIPARKGSKSIKNKNIKLFNGKPLIAWTIEQALSSDVDRVIVTTDSKSIRDIALSYGAEVPYMRPSELANDTIGIEPVLIDVLNFLKNKELYVPNCVVLMMPTSPFRKANDVNQAIEIFRKEKATSVVSVTYATANNNPEWMLKKNDKDKVVMFDGGKLSKMASRRQDLPSYYMRNDFVFVIYPGNLYLEDFNLYGDKVELMQIPEDRLDIDINTNKDWKIAELLYKIK